MGLDIVFLMEHVVAPGFEVKTLLEGAIPLLIRKAFLKVAEDSSLVELVNIPSFEQLHPTIMPQLF